MAGLTQVQIEKRLAAIQKALAQSADSVRFPDGSEIRNVSREILVQEEARYLALLEGILEPDTPSRRSFVVRTSKGLG